MPSADRFIFLCFRAGGSRRSVDLSQGAGREIMDEFIPNLCQRCRSGAAWL